MACTAGYFPFTQDTEQKLSPRRNREKIKQQIAKVYEQLKPYGVHSARRLRTANFTYTGNGDTAQCNACDLQVSGWIREMDPYHIHCERSPDCPFIRSEQRKAKFPENGWENAAKRQKTELHSNTYSRENRLVEVNILQEIRQRTFSHWTSKTAPTKEQMIKAGFFQCNVGDRVICLYCNLIAQQWNGEIDDPIEVHRILSPNCAYVRSMLTPERSSSVFIVNEYPTNNTSNAASLLNSSARNQFDQIVSTTPCHAIYSSIPSRHATFERWPNDSTAPSVDDLVRVGFFYTQTKNVVTCFYCNGSLQNWGKNDDPLIEHIRWFPLCLYAKQLAGIDLYNKVQEAKRARQAHERSEASDNPTGRPTVPNSRKLQITDEKLLSRLVAARLDLPISQRLLDQYFKSSVIKRCWEDQLQLKQDDFFSDGDLHVACLILQKQIDYINGNKDNIIIPSLKMKSIRDGEQHVSSDKPVTQVNQIIPVEEPMVLETVTEPVKAEETVVDTKITVNNPCVMCGNEEKRLACIPCGHLVACINCSKTLRTCPVCRRSIEAFVRIYI